MTSLLYFLAALAVSAAALWYLQRIDPKRARVFNRGAQGETPSRPRLAWGVGLAPGLILPALGELSAFLTWLGAITVVGWLIALKRPRDRSSSSA
ncbi:MAG: hypothetical protein AAGC56_01775 [Pseudomonadota bacterium]